MFNEGLPDTLYERALMLENMLVAKAAGDHGTRDAVYTQLRQEFMNDPVLKALLPLFVQTCRDLSHFWSYAKKISPHWEPRRQHVREKFIPLLEHLEGKNQAPVDAMVSDALASFDAERVHAVWNKALARRGTDPDGAITIARTLLETVCKRVLDEASSPNYADDTACGNYTKWLPNGSILRRANTPRMPSGESSEAARVWLKASVRFAIRSVMRMAKGASNCELLHAMRNLL